jgi:hypothetical protein
MRSYVYKITDTRAPGTKGWIMAHDEAQRAAGPTRLVIRNAD